MRSPEASERVWSLACGFPNKKRRNRLFAVLQVCIDESGHGDPDLFVCAGYISTTERWAAFSDEWQRLIDHESPHYRKLEYFKMVEMSSERDRERCRWFHNVIEKYALASISYTIPTKVFLREVNRMFTDQKIRRELSTPWHCAASALMLSCTHNRSFLNLPDEPIDFVFDDISQKNVVISTWDQFKKVNAGQAPSHASTPIFRNDREYLPLQAADLFAWWVRHWQVDGIKGKEIYNCEYPWPRESNMPWLHVVADRTTIRARLRQIRNWITGTYQFNF